MKKLPLVIVLVVAIFSLSMGCMDDSKNSTEKNHYTYTLLISTKPNTSYNLIISIPEGWPNFLNSLSKRSGSITLHNITTINGQPALNITGIGNVTIVFEMTSEEENLFSYVKNWNKNGTLLYLNKSSNEPIHITMEDVLSQ